jgi:hypothetical protein
MLLPVLLTVLAAGAQPRERPITVTGHAWAPFISPMGEPFRPRAATDDTLARWFGQADRNGDGMLAADEMRADADRFFATLDLDHDGEIDPDELAQYEYEVAPDIQVMSRRRPAPGQPRANKEREDFRSSYPHGLQGAARYAVLNIPEPVAAADTDFDRSITLAEFRTAALYRFQLLGAGQGKVLSLAQLQALRGLLGEAGRRASPDRKSRDLRIGNPLPRGD